MPAGCGEGGAGADGDAQTGQLRAVEDVHVDVPVDGGAAEPAQGGVDRGRVEGEAADLAGGEGVALGGVEVPRVDEHDVAIGHRPRPLEIEVGPARPGV